MAATAPSPLASSVEETNGAKLSRLVIDGGTTVLRNIFNRYHPPAYLVADLNANYSTLTNLLRKRVLHKPHWNQLFQPGRTTPDSNTFDITLLFLLLTNICGLSPPPSGWHTKPPPGDNSLAANLTRIKYFRNEVFGNMSSTCTSVDVPTFTALWQEISAALVALGLHQADIDRLKEERWGEGDYIDVSPQWADSEEDVKSQLKYIRQFQTKVHRTQEEDYQTFTDCKAKLEEIYQIGKVMKEGTPSDNELEELSKGISTSWMDLARRLRISQAILDGIYDVRWSGLAEKAYRMLLRWKQENGSSATYRVLSDALCHVYVNRSDLAEYICFAPAQFRSCAAWSFDSGMESRDASSVEDQLQSIPLYIQARGDEHKAAYQRALETGKTLDKRVKVMLIGQDRAGKTSVGRSLKGEEFRKDESSTEGVQMHKPLKQVGTKPWKNSNEEQETTAFVHKCAQAISDYLSTDRSSEGKALGKEEMTEKMADKKELSVDDELHGPQERKTATKDAAELESLDRNAKREDDIRVPDEVTRLTIKKLSQKNSDNDDKIWPVIWDFAGQAIFRAIHPIFVSREAIYVLVLDLTKELSAIAQCCVKEPDHEEAKIPAPDSNDTNLDHILRWMDLVHCFKHHVSGETLPPVILVGTHADLLQDPSDKITKVEDKIRHTARVFSDHIIRKTFLNNTLAGKQEEDPQIVSLREEILKVGEGMPHTKDDVPLKWLQVENEVYDLASKGTNYITREDFKKNISDEICQFENEDDFEVLLHFLHDRGTVVYHGCANDKRSLVVLNPEWLVDILCQIITVDKQSEDKTRIHNLREDFEMTGILHSELLDDSCDRLKLRDIKDSLLYIMKKFNLLCEYTSKEGSSIYLVPCMLTLSPDELKLNNSGNQNPAPVYITFNTKYVPAGLFSRLVVLFMEYAQIIHSDQPELSANYAHFFIGESVTGIKFVCYKRVIKVLVWDHSNSNRNPVEKEPHICLKLLSVLKDSLKSLHEECHWLEAVSWDLCARCNLCPPELASKTTGECFWHGEKECRHDDCAHYVSVTKKLVRCSRTKGRNRCPPKTWCQALEDASRHNQDEVPDKEQTSTVGFKRQRPNQDTQATVPAKVARTAVKDGIPEDNRELHQLANDVSAFWRALGRELKVEEPKLVQIDRDNQQDTYEKAYQMLMHWRNDNADAATYLILFNALTVLGHSNLAKQYCTV